MTQHPHRTSVGDYVRVWEIINAPEAAGQESFARYLAEETLLSAEAALGALRTSPVYLDRAKRRQCGRVSDPFVILNLTDA